MSGCQRLAMRRRASCTSRCSKGGSISSSSSACSTSRTLGIGSQRYRDTASADNRWVLFELQDVTATRARTAVLQDLSAGLPEGATCVAGPSGAGKSTLLRLLNRLADPDHGRVLYRGRDVRDLDVLSLRREVCLVPQLPALLEGTVADNVLFGVRLAGRAGDVERALDLAGLSGRFA